MNSCRMGVCTDCNEGGDGESNRGGAVRVNSAVNNAINGVTLEQTTSASYVWKRISQAFKVLMFEYTTLYMRCAYRIAGNFRRVKMS